MAGYIILAYLLIGALTANIIFKLSDESMLDWISNEVKLSDGSKFYVGCLRTLLATIICLISPVILLITIIDQLS